MQRSDALESLLESGTEQGGNVTSGQAIRLGLARDDISRLVRSNDLRRVRRGVFAMRHADERHEHEIAAWLHFTRDRLPWERANPPKAVISHSSAASLRGLGTIIPTRPVVTLTTGSPPHVADIETHRVSLRDDDWEWLDLGSVKLPVTTPSRTIVDLLLDGEEPSYVERSVAEAFRRGDADPASVMDAARHRKGPSKARERRTAELLERVA